MTCLRVAVALCNALRVTLPAGEVTYRDGRATGAKPGNLVRGAQGKRAQKLAAE